MTFEKNAMTVKLGPTVKDFARYQLQVTTGAVVDGVIMLGSDTSNGVLVRFR